MDTVTSHIPIQTRSQPTLSGKLFLSALGLSILSGTLENIVLAQASPATNNSSFNETLPSQGEVNINVAQPLADGKLIGTAAQPESTTEPNSAKKNEQGGSTDLATVVDEPARSNAALEHQRGGLSSTTQSDAIASTPSQPVLATDIEISTSAGTSKTNTNAATTNNEHSNATEVAPLKDLAIVLGKPGMPAVIEPDSVPVETASVTSEPEQIKQNTQIQQRGGLSSDPTGDLASNGPSNATDNPTLMAEDGVIEPL